MTKLSKEFQVKLDTPISYAYEGEMVEAQFILVKKPTVKNMSLISPISSIYQTNLQDWIANIDGLDETLEKAREIVDLDKAKKKAAGEEEEKDEEEKMSWDDALKIAYKNPDNVVKLTSCFSELLRNGLFLLDGVQKLTVPLIDEMDSDDFEKLLGSFIVNFTHASLFR